MNGSIRVEETPIREVFHDGNLVRRALFEIHYRLNKKK